MGQGGKSLVVDWGPPTFYVRKGFPSTGNFCNICAEEGNEYFPLAEKLKLRWKVRANQVKPVTMATVWGRGAGIT